MACCSDLTSEAPVRINGPTAYRDSLLGCGIVIALLCTVLMALPAAIAGAQSGVAGQMTAEMRQAAVQCGRSGVECAVRPYELCRDRRGFQATLVTPFSRVALAALEADRNQQPLGRIGPKSVNRWGVSIQVLPDAQFTRALAITHVELLRDGQILQPVSTTVGPITITRPDGSTETSKRGSFLFSADAFEPSADLEIVFRSTSDPVSCRLDRDLLRQLR